jgi:hypothetical protein
MSAVTDPQPGTSTDPQPDTNDPLRGRFRSYVSLVLILAVAIFVAVGIVNRQLNPLVYNPDHIRDVAAALAEGRNYANYDTNINWRALRREQIRRMKVAPDVIVFGGSRWWEASSELVPNQTFFNAWVSNDQAEDVMALAYLLDEAGRLPKTLILSLRFISFQPPAQREFAEWQEWAPEYRKMADRLGVAPHSYLTTFPIKSLYGMFYAPAVYDRALQVSAAPEAPGVTTDRQRPSIEIIAADGSVRWSRASEAKFTKKFVDDAVKKELRQIGQNAPKIDLALVAAMEKTIQFLQNKGVRVVVAQTPYHPDFYREIQKRPFGKTLNRLESIAQEMSRRLGVISVGGYDPAPLGCTADQFIDHIHSRPPCLVQVLRRIPGLVQGG